MWCPGVAAILASLLTKRPLAQIGWRWGKTRYQVASYFVPVAYSLVAYGATWALGLGRFPNSNFVETTAARLGGASPAATIGRYVLLQATVGMVFSILAGLGEEIGWRGLLVPELARRFSFTRTALLSGVIWAVWHYPILLFADYNAGTPGWYGLTCFTVLVLGISFLFAWLRLKSGSVWTAAILHGSHNLFVQGVFDPLTGDTGRTKWIIGEFGAALAIVAVGVAALTWRRRGEVEPRPDTTRTSPG